MSGARVQYPAGRRPGELTDRDRCAFQPAPFPGLTVPLAHFRR